MLNPGLSRLTLLDPLLQDRYVRHLDRLLELVDKEVLRTQWEKPFQSLAQIDEK